MYGILETPIYEKWYKFDDTFSYFAIVSRFLLLELEVESDRASINQSDRAIFERK